MKNLMTLWAALSVCATFAVVAAAVEATAPRPRQLVTPDTGSLVVTCGACGEMAAGHAPCFACEGSGAGTRCSDALSVPCDALAGWLSEHGGGGGNRGPPPALEAAVTILTCEACDGKGASHCTRCDGTDCSDPYEVECDVGGDLGWAELVGLGE